MFFSFGGALTACFLTHSFRHNSCSLLNHRFRHYSCPLLLSQSPWATLLWVRHVPNNSCCLPRSIASVLTLGVSIGYIRLPPQASAFQASCLRIAFGIYPAVYRIPHRGPTPISLSVASIMRSHLFFTMQAAVTIHIAIPPTDISPRLPLPHTWHGGGNTSQWIFKRLFC